MSRIGLIATNLAGSGAEKIVLHLAEMFRYYGDEADIFLLEDVVTYDAGDLDIHTLSKNRSLFKLFKGFGDAVLARKLRSKIAALEKKGRKFDLFLSNLPAADRVAAKANLPHLKYLIHTSYSMELQEFRRRGKLRRAANKEILYRRLYKDKELIAVSEGIKADIDQMGIAYSSCEVIYNPFDIQKIRMQGAEPVEKITGAYLLSASAFRPVKRHDILLQAYSKLKDPLPLKLLCNSDPRLERMIGELGIKERVEILGFAKNPYPIIKNAKLLILSSEREGLPTVLIEALILGTPVVSTDCRSGPDEILTGALSAYLARVNDADDLSSKIADALVYYPPIEDIYLQKFAMEHIYERYTVLMRS